MDRRSLAEEVARRLVRAYGRRNRRIDDPFDVLVRTILSQNTTDVNSHRAFRRLKERFPTAADLASAAVEDIEDAIRAGGLHQRKAQVIKSVAQVIRDRGIDLRELEPRELQQLLLSLDGVGPKTVACVLLFGLGTDVLPVDTHVYRVSRRIGLIGEVTRERAQAQLELITPPRIRYQLHLLLIEHGRRVCRARNPSCDRCVLHDICRYGRLASRMSKAQAPDG